MAPNCGKRCNSRCSEKCDRPVCCPKKCECVCVDVTVEKRLLTACRIPLAALVQWVAENLVLPATIPFGQIMFTYEITIVNNSPHRISGLVLNDSLAGINFQNNGAVALPFPSTLRVVKAPGNIVLLPYADIAASNGNLINAEQSFLDPCSVTKIIMELTVSAPEDSFCEVRQVTNTITLEGKVEEAVPHGKCGKCIIKRHCMKPIVAASDIWKTDSDFALIFGINFNFNFTV